MSRNDSASTRLDGRENLALFADLYSVPEADLAHALRV